MTVTTAPATHAHHAGPRDDRPIWRRPNLLRAFIFFAVGCVFAYVLVGLIGAPMFFLVGLGAFDYWFYWAAGKPTRPEDHSSHGAYSWRDYFRINTDHKVIGIQYTVHSF